MFALLLTPITIATLLLGAESGSLDRTNVRNFGVLDTVRALPAIDTSIPMLNVDMLNNIAAVKKGLETLIKTNPELGGNSLNVAIRTKSYEKYENSVPFQELTKKHGFTVPKFFSAYREVVSGIQVLKAEKRLGKTNLLETQEYSIIPPNKRFVIKNEKLIGELKLASTFVGQREMNKSPFGGSTTDSGPMR